MTRKKVSIYDVKEDVLRVLTSEYMPIHRICFSVGHSFYRTKEALIALCEEKKAEKIEVARKTQMVLKYRKVPQASSVMPSGTPQMPQDNALLVAA